MEVLDVHVFVRGSFPLAPQQKPFFRRCLYRTKGKSISSKFSLTILTFKVTEENLDGTFQMHFWISQEPVLYWKPRVK